ncbi:MAG: VWA domain-containing protein [Bacteroidia bacterium]|nr:VWA domain-containing protein [Bacteroidia bacterium]
MRFANPYMLYLLLLVPVAIVGYYYLQNKRHKALKAFGEENLIKHLMPLYSPTRQAIKAWILLVAFSLQVLILARPQFGTKMESTKRSGIELMVALDVSNSMNAMDVSPSRLEMAKMAVSRLVDKLSGDRLGIVVFAGQAYVQLPITTDYPSAKMFLSSVSTGMVPTQGTAIGAAINMCRNSFTSQENINRAIVVITDGENHEDDGIAAAKQAAAEGIRVYTVGMGTTKGSPVPVTPGNTRDFIKDKQGNVVITKIDEQSLVNIAAEAGGAYIPANNIRNGINALIEELDHIEKSEFESKVFAQYSDKFQYLEIIVIALLLIDLLILGRKNTRLSAFDIFTRKENAKDLFN